MTTTKVSVQRHIEQVHEGAYYKGYIDINNVRFDYELVLTISFARLPKIPPKTDVEEVSRIFNIIVRRDIVFINLTEEEYNFFFSLIVGFAVNLYQELQAQKIMKALVDLAPELIDSSPLVYRVSIGKFDSFSYQFPEHVCTMLSAPKFGCVFESS